MATHRKAPGPAEHRYCNVQVRRWTDAKLTQWGLPPPHPFTLFDWLLTSPFTLRIPGVSVGGRAGMAEALRWPLGAFDDCFGQLAGAGLATADWQARLVYLPGAFRQPENRPSSPSTAATWKRELANAPECELLVQITDDLRDLLRDMHPAFLNSFDRGSRRDLRRKLPAPLAGELPGPHPSPSPAPAPALSPAPAPPPTGVQGAGGRLEGKKNGSEAKALPAARPKQLTIADRVDPAPGPAGQAPLLLAEVLRRIEADAGGRFVISHRTRPGERRNGAAEQVTMGLPQLLWDQLRAAVHELAPSEAEVERLGAWLGAGGWGHLEKVTPDYLHKHLYDGLTRAAAWDGTPLRPGAPEAPLPEVTAAAGTPEFFDQLKARKAEQTRREAAKEQRYGR